MGLCGVNAMDVGIFVFTIGATEDVAVLAKRAESLGFESFWVPEHPAVPVHTTSPYAGSPDGSIPDIYWQIVDPFVALGRASAVTSTIKLGTAVCLVPEHNPIHLAKQVATVDHYSEGRFIFGIGTGWIKEETEVMGGDFARRWTQTREAVLAMKELWTKDEAEFHGRYVDFPPLRSFPKPKQKPHPPVYLGSKAANVFKRVVSWGEGWMPNRITPEEIRAGRASLNELARQAGRDPKSITISVLPNVGQVYNREVLKSFEEAGTDLVLLRIQPDSHKPAIEEMEEFASWALA